MALVFKLTSDTYDKTLRVSEVLLARVLEALKKEGRGREERRTGGYLRLRYASDVSQGLRGWHQFLKARVGELEDWETKEVFSEEKQHRLMKAHAHSYTNVSSYQSRDPDNWQYGGAVILDCYIPELGGRVRILASFSGLPEDADEAFVLLLLKEMGWEPRVLNRLPPITSYSENKFAEELLTA